jgi:hypothetical protein
VLNKRKKSAIRKKRINRRLTRKSAWIKRKLKRLTVIVKKTLSKPNWHKNKNARSRSNVRMTNSLNARERSKKRQRVKKLYLKIAQ